MSDPSWQLHPNVHPMTVGTLLDCVLDLGAAAKGLPDTKSLLGMEGGLARGAGGHPPDFGSVAETAPRRRRRIFSSMVPLVTNSPLPQTTRIRTSTHSHVSDRFSPFATQTIPATVHEAPYILDGLLMNETGRRVREQYADTGGFTDHVFAACSIALAHLRAVLARCYTRRLDALARSTQASVSVAKAINFSLPPPEASSSAASRFALASSVSPRFSLMHPRL